MKIVKAIDKNRILYHEEPISDLDWYRFDENNLNLTDCQSWLWAAFFVIQREEAPDFIDSVWACCKRITRADPMLGEFRRSKYTNIGVFINAWDIDLIYSQKSCSMEQRLWMSCMRVTRIYNSWGASLFSPISFLNFDRGAALAIMQTGLEADTSGV